MDWELWHDIFLYMYAGGENEAPVDGCNDMCVKGEGAGDGTNQLVEDQCTVQYSKGKRLSEAILTLQNQCQVR